MRTKHWVRSAPLSVLALLVLGACSSSTDQRQHSQAVDGFIVGGDFFCSVELKAEDDKPNGETDLAGRLACHKNSVLVTVEGGWDVGFDETKKTSSSVFIGQLTAPASLGYVTPLSTVAVRMATNENGSYKDGLFGEKVESLGIALGAKLDLSKNPADFKENPELIRFNQQIHQVISAFSKTKSEYGEAIAAFATVVTTNEIGKPLDLGSGVKDTLERINSQLPPGLKKQPADLASTALSVSAINLSIDAAVTEGDADKVVAAAVDAAVARASVTIDRSAQSVTLTSANSTFELSIDDFEDNTKSNGSYQTQVDSGLAQVGYNNEVLQFDKDLVNVQVTMGFELKSTDVGDTRGLSFYSDDIRLSATKGQSDSLVISLPDGATLHAVGTDSMNTTTTAEVQLEAANTFSNANGQFSVNYSSVVDELEDLGYEDIFANAAGNYEMTLIIGGIQLKELSASGVAVPAAGYDISVGDVQRNGAGFKGYISYLD